MKIKFIILCGLLLTNCSQFALIASGTSLVVSQNAITKFYNTTDVITVISTKKSIKKHIEDTIIKERKE